MLCISKNTFFPKLNFHKKWMRSEIYLWKLKNIYYYLSEAGKKMKLNIIWKINLFQIFYFSSRTWEKVTGCKEKFSKPEKPAQNIEYRVIGPIIFRNFGIVKQRKTSLLPSPSACDTERTTPFLFPGKPPSQFHSQKSFSLSLFIFFLNYTYCKSTEWVVSVNSCSS